jgi:hypothetical protein
MKAKSFSKKYVSGKKGLEMAVTTVILIILSISVLTLLVIFLNSQTGFLARWFKTQTTESNVDAVVSSCNNLVMIESVYAYCCEKKEVRFEAGVASVRVTCSEASSADWSSNRIQKLDCLAMSCVG